MRAACLVWVLVGCAGDPPREWTLVYYLPYDNDLSAHADPILAELEAGVSERAAVIALVDRPGEGGMERVTLTAHGRSVVHVAAEDSADPRVLGRLLDRATRELPAEHYALFVLDHGGQLEELGLDEHPRRRWMPAGGLARELAAWRRRQGRRLDSLVLQQCGRGTIETYHLLRHEADVIVASQGILAAPNDYYGAMLAAIDRGEVSDGDALARAVIEGEAPEMFVEYTAVRGPALDALPAHLDRAIAPLLAAPDTPADATASTFTLRWAEEPYADLALFLRALYRSHGLDEAPLDALVAFLERAVSHRRVSPSSPRARVLGGFSVMVPTDPAALDRHAGVPLYRGSQLDELMRRHPQRALPEVVELPGSTVAARP